MTVDANLNRSRPFDCSGPAPTPADIAEKALKGLAGRRRMGADAARVRMNATSANAVFAQQANGLLSADPEEWTPEQWKAFTSSDLYHLAAARRMGELREAEQRAAASADAFDWAALRAWLPHGHRDKFVGVPDKPALGAYWAYKTSAVA